MEKYILSLDSGTTSVRAILFNKNGEAVSSASKELNMIYQKPGWVEQNPMEIWSSQLSVIIEVISKFGISPKNIDSIGITNQRETTILWDSSTGNPIGNAISWQCNRTIDIMNRFKDIDENSIYFKTGLRLNPYFSVSKMIWLLENEANVIKSLEKGTLKFGTVDSWLLWKLSGGKVHATDYTNASRTLLYNINTLSWDDELIETFKIPKEILPNVYPSSHNYGYTDISFLGNNIPICSIIGDQQSALFGQKCYHKGDVKNTYGTGGFMLLNTGTSPVFNDRNIITTIAWGYDSKVYYALEGSIFSTGSTVQWLKDEIKLIDSYHESELISNSIDTTDGCYIVPAFNGLGTPYWNNNCTAIITGITRGTGKAQIVRACLESMAYQVNDVLFAMKNAETSINIDSILIDGGGSRNKFVLQFLADISNTKVYQSAYQEATARGCAFMSGLQSGFYPSLEFIETLPDKKILYEPVMEEKDRKDALLGWNNAVKKAIN